MVNLIFKLGPELDKIKQLLIENGYPADVLPSCINQKLANFAAEKTFMVNYDINKDFNIFISFPDQATPLTLKNNSRIIFVSKPEKFKKI